MENTRVIQCFIASPNDTAEECKLCKKVMDEINTSLGSSLGFRLESKTWEDDVHPSIGTDGQDVINRQIGLDYDIFIGIMYQRFGTPTPRAGSGTEEEFDRAFALHEKHPEVEIMFYFNRQATELEQIDIQELGKVNAFREKVREAGCLTWDYKGPEAFEDCLRQHLQMRLTEIFPLRQETKKEKGNSCDIRKFLADQLIQRRKCHPSFRLMEISDELFPDGNLELYNIEAVNDVDEKKSVREIVEESWSREKNHLMIEGEGGIGKTVTLLSLPDKFVPHSVPAIYIQLHELKRVKKDETIEEYIQKEVFHQDRGLFGQFLQLANTPWSDGPQILLLLDGFNEIAPENRYAIGEDINRWADWNGIQIITSSRYDIHSYVPLGAGYGRVHLQPLTSETIKVFLRGLGLAIPKKGSNQWNVISHPLMLTLYAQTEKALERIEKTEDQSFKKSNSIGAIIWNYLQRELWRYRDHPEAVLKCVLAAEFIAPYIAWQMQKDSLFFLQDEVFRNYCDAAYELVSQLDSKQLPPHIRRVFRKNHSKYPEKEDIIRFIEVELRLFVKRKDSYSLMHQQFRDALAALHLINVSYYSSDLPDEWKYPVDYYVLNFVHELASQDEADKLWEHNRTSSSSRNGSILNMLELQKRMRKYDFTQLNFSGLNLDKLSLFPYKNPESTALHLPGKSESNERLILSRRTLYPTGHSDCIKVLAVTPDGKKCISGSLDSTMRVWNLENGICLHVLEGHKSAVSTLAVTPDGKKCVSGSYDGTLRVWDLDNGKCLRVLYGHTGWVSILAITPDGKKIVSGSSDSTLRVWYLENGGCAHVLEGQIGYITTLAITPDGKRCVSGTDFHTLRVWNLENGEWSHVLVGHAGSIIAIAITPDGKRCVSGSSDNRLRVWDLDDGRCIHVLKGHEDWIRTVAITPDGRRCISGGDDCTLRIWDLEIGECIATLPWHKSQVNAIVLTPDGRKCVAGSSDGTLSAWDLENRQFLHSLEKSSWKVRALAITPDGKRCVSGEYNTLRVWDIENWQCIHVLEGHKRAVTTLAISPDGQRCVSGAGHHLRSWDLERLRCIHLLEGHNDWIRAIAITSFKTKRDLFKADIVRCISGSADQTLRVWDLLDGKCLHVLEGHNGPITVVAITPDGKRGVSGAEDNTLRVWDLENGKCLHVLEGHEGPITTLAITPDGKRGVSGSEDYPLRVWDLEKGICTHVLVGHKEPVTTLVITPDGKRGVSGSDDDTLRVWNLENGRCLHILKDAGSVTDLAVTPDGKRCVSGSAGGRLFFWDLENGICSFILKFHDWIRSVAITPDGKKAVSVSDDGELTIVDLKKRKCIYSEYVYFGSETPLAMITPDGKRSVIGSQNSLFHIIDIENLSSPANHHENQALDSTDDEHQSIHTLRRTLEVLPLSLIGVDFSKSIIPDNLKETLKQNGAIV